MRTLAVAVVLLLAAVPVAGLAVAALGSSPDPYADVAIRWDRALSAAGTSLVLATGVTLGALGVGGVLGWAQARWSGRLTAALCALATLPLVVPSYVLAATLARGWADLTGVPPSGLAAATGVLVLSTAPLVQLTVATAMRRVSAAEEEAARALGAAPSAVFRAVHWPRLRPALAFSGLLAALYAVSDFGAVAVLDVPALTWRMYDAVARAQLARAAVLGGLAFLIVLPLGTALWRLRGSDPAAGVANPRPVEPRPPGRSAVAAWALAGFVALAGVAVPVGLLGMWVVDGWARGETFAPLLAPLLHTLVAAGGGALVTTAAATVVAVAPRRGPGLEAAVYATSVLPGILLAFGWLGVALGIARALGGGPGTYGAILGSGALLGLGYAARYLAEVHAPIRTAALRLDPRHADAVRVLGASRTTWLRRVAAPALAPGVRTGAVLAFLLLCRELPITLVLGGPTGLQTLAFRLWDRHSEALWHDAGAAGLLIVGIALAGRLLLAPRGEPPPRPAGRIPERCDRGRPERADRQDEEAGRGETRSRQSPGGFPQALLEGRRG